MIAFKFKKPTNKRITFILIRLYYYLTSLRTYNIVTK